jgi:ketosteroid isomerase-like protein
MLTIRSLLLPLSILAAVGIPTQANAQSAVQLRDHLAAVHRESTAAVANRDAALQLLTAHLGLWSADDPERYPYGEVVAEDVVFLFPYAENGNPQLRGLESALPVLRGLAAAGTDWKFSEIRLYNTLHADVFFAEYRASAFVPATGRTYQGRHVARITLRDGKIAEYLEIWDQDAKAQAFGHAHRPVLRS